MITMEVERMLFFNLFYATITSLLHPPAETLVQVHKFFEQAPHHLTRYAQINLSTGPNLGAIH